MFTPTQLGYLESQAIPKAMQGFAALGSIVRKLQAGKDELGIPYPLTYLTQLETQALVMFNGLAENIAAHKAAIIAGTLDSLIPPPR